MRAKRCLVFGLRRIESLKVNVISYALLKGNKIRKTESVLLIQKNPRSGISVSYERVGAAIPPNSK
jgi:hypothetical protein